MATEKELKDRLAKEKAKVNDEKKSDTIRNKAKKKIAEIENDLAELGGDVVKGAKEVVTKGKDLAKMTDKEFEEAKKDLADKLGNTEEECENIIKEFKEQRARAKRSKAKRTQQQQKSGETITPKSSEINTKKVLSNASNTIGDKLQSEVDGLESEAKRSAKDKVKDQNLTTAQKNKKIEELVKNEVRKKSKFIADSVAIETKSIISEISSKLSSIDKQLRLTYLRKVKAEIEALISKMMFGGLTDGAVANLNVTQSQMSAESVNPQFAKGGKTRNLDEYDLTSEGGSKGFIDKSIKSSEGIIDVLNEHLKKPLLKGEKESNRDYIRMSISDLKREIAELKEERKKYAKGGKTKGLEHFLRNADKITTKDGKVVSKSEFLKKQRENEDFEKGLDDLYPNLGDDYKKGKFDKGGGVEDGREVGKIYQIKGADVTFYEDSYEEGEQGQFHDYFLGENEFPYKTKFSNKKDLFETLNDFISYADMTQEDFFVDEDTIQASALVKYEKDSDWDEFSAPSEREIELWKNGEMKLYNAMFVFPYEVYRKERLDFENGGEIMTADTTFQFADGGRVRTNSKVVREAVRQHILDNANFDVEDFDNIDDASTYMIERFKSEFDNPYERQRTPNAQDRFREYLMGLPFSFPYYDDDIEEFLNSLGINPEGKKYSEEQMRNLYYYLIWREIKDKYKMANGGEIMTADTQFEYAKGGGLYEKSTQKRYLEKYAKNGNLIRTAEQFDSGNWVVSEYPQSKTNLQGEYTNEEFNEIRRYFYAKGGRMEQGYNDRMDESLGMRHRGRHSQGHKDRRDEAKGMNKAMGNRAYQSVGTMDRMAKGGQLFDDLNIKKGAFTKKAKQRGLSTEAFMRKVLANPSRYDERTRKQAQLMKNMM